MLSDETSYKLLKLLASEPDVSQRAIARELGISLGKANYCLKALIGAGFVNARGREGNEDESSYRYSLTPTGIEEKARVTLRFLRAKVNQYAALEVEIEEIRQEAERICDTGRAAGTDRVDSSAVQVDPGKAGRESR